MSLSRQKSSDDSLGSYVLITPVRNEMQRLPTTIRCLLSQTHRPCEWVVVDDGSSDGSWEYLRQELGDEPSVRLVKREDRGHSEVGAGVVEAFMDGLAAVESREYRYLGKLDGDIELSPGYFADLVGRMDEEPELGIASGQNYLRSESGELEVEHHARFHPVGGARLYRREVFAAIGGLVRTPGWDTLDLVRSRRLGYRTENFEDLEVIHLRPMGTRADLGKAVRRHGRVAYLLGYSRLYFLARVLRHAFRSPRPRRAIWLLEGYLEALREGVPEVPERDEIHWLRRFQRRRLLTGSAGGEGWVGKEPWAREVKGRH